MGTAAWKGGRGWCNVSNDVCGCALRTGWRVSPPTPQPQLVLPCSYTLVTTTTELGGSIASERQKLFECGFHCGTAEKSVVPSAPCAHPHDELASTLNFAPHAAVVKRRRPAHQPEWLGRPSFAAYVNV